MQNKKKIKDADGSQRKNAPGPSEAELRYSAVFDQSPDGILIIDAEGKIIDFNKAAHTDLGYSREEFSKLRISDIDPVESPAEIRASLQRIMDEKKAEFEVAHRTKSGQWRNVLVITQAIVLSGRTVLHTIWRDITDQKTAGKALLESEAKYRDLFENAGDAVFVLDAELRYADVNRRGVDLLGYTREELLGRKPFDFVPEQQRLHSDAGFEKLRRIGACEVFEGRMLTKDGRWIDIEVSSTAIFRDGAFAGSRDIVRDITDRKKTEKKLMSVMKAVESASDAIGISDALGHHFYQNKALSDLFEYATAEELEAAGGGPAVVKDPLVAKEMFDTIMGGKSWTGELEMVTKSGRVFTAFERADAIKDSEGNIIGLIGIITDISERKRAEESLLYFQMAVGSATDAIGMSTPEGRHYYQNEAFTKLFGLSVSEVDGVSGPPATVYADEKVGRKIFDKIKLGGSFAGEVKMLDRDRNERDIYLRAYSIKSKEGKVVGLVGMHADITDRNKAEEKLKMSERQLAESQKVAKIGSWSWNVTNNTLEWSDETFRRFDKDPGTFTPSTEYFLDRIHSDDRESVRKALQDSLKNNAPYHIRSRIINDDGREWVMEAFGIVEKDINGNPLRFAGTAQDITVRKQAEEALKESETQFMELFRNAADAIFIADTESGVIVEANEAASRLMLLPHDDIIGLHQSRLHPPQTENYSHEVFEDHKNEIAQMMPTHPVEHTVLRSDGLEVPIEILAAMVTIRGKKCVMGTFRDITERKKSEEKILQSEAFIRNILDTVDEGFIVIDRDFRILTANKAYCSQVGQSCDSVIGRHCYTISHKTLRPCYEEGEECAVRYVFATGEPHSALHKHPDANDSILYVETKAFPIKDSTGAVISVIETVNNVTEKHLLEEEQLKSQKLEAIGLLAGGIAHDFNNLLQGVFGYISMAKLTMDEKERSLTMLEQAEKALHMSVNLATQLLTFSKGGKPVKKKIQLQSVIENSVRFALSGSNVEFRITFDDNLLGVDADEGQISQVIQNIVLNADQAMPLGGKIAITARNVSAPHKGLSALLAGGQYVEIAVKDNGSGIPEQYLPRLFDPYFTTKERGSGLGLATTYSIIKSHSGLIDVKSELGRGSTFFVYLPALEIEEKSFVTIPSTADATRKGRILLMDDEELIRNIVGIMLKALGHEVEFAENGGEAIAKYREALSSGRRFDIVILDLTIRGGMGGEETMRELLALDPEVKAVVSSGYSDSSMISEYKSHGFSACLAKPYEVDALRGVLNQLMR